MRTWLANKMAYPIYISRFLKRHKAITSVLRAVVILLIIGFVFFPDATLIVLRLAAQIGFGVVYIVFYFGAMLMFLSRSKTITILPRRRITDLGNGYGEVTGDKSDSGLTLDDYKGQPGLVALMGEWISILQGDANFYQMGGISPSGLVLIGEPGTGKSYLAKCLAGSAGVAMHGIAGSGFRAMFMGMDVMKTISFVNKCRSLAAEHGSCIAFIDELDALGSRGSMGGMGMMGGMMGGGALTQLLVAIDGMGEERGMTTARNIARRRLRLPPLKEGVVLWMGSTNMPERLDPALIRPGRMEHMIKVDPPDGPGRKEIFVYYAAKVKHEDLDIDRLVSGTQGLTPAAIQSATQRGAPRLANAAGRSKISEMDILTALMEGVAGIPNPITDMPEKQRWQLAVHEASHCVASYHLSPSKTIAFVSIIRRGIGFGFMLPIDKEATYTFPMANIVADIRVSLAGDIGTKVVLGERWVGGAADFRHVRERIAYLSWHGVFGGISQEYGKPSQGESERIDKWLKEQMGATEDLLAAHQPEIEALATALVEKSELSGEEATKIIQKAEK